MNRNKIRVKDTKSNILFISTYLNYFVENHPSFYRMYGILTHFHDHKDFNVIVLQPEKDVEEENLDLKSNITTYYFKEHYFAGINLAHLIDLHLGYLLKVRKIIKKHQINLIHVDYLYGINSLKFITKIPVSYNSYNVEYVYASQVSKVDFKIIPKFLRICYPKFIFFLEKWALKSVKNINAVSSVDKQKFIDLYRVDGKKIQISRFGYSKKIYDTPMDKLDARERLKINKNKFVIIFHTNYYTSYTNRESINIIRNKIAPRIKDKNIVIVIAGRMPAFKNTRTLRFLGFLDDLNDFIYSADIAIAPIIRGSGVNVKVIDYLSGRIPVITMEKGIEGLEFKDGVHGYIVKNSVKAMIDKIVVLKNSPKKVIEFKRNINKLILTHYQWEGQLEKIVEAYKLIIK